MKVLAYSILLLVIATSCLPEPIDIDVKQAESKSVVSTQVLPGNGMALWLTKSFSALSNGNNGDISSQDLSKYLISDAKVSISYNNQKVELVSLIGGLYGSNQIEQIPGISYELQIEEPNGGKTLKATTQVLPLVNLDSATVKFELMEEFGDDDYKLTTNFKLNDPAGKNYYMYSIIVNPVTELVEEINGEGSGQNPIGLTNLNNVLAKHAKTWVFEDNSENDGKEITGEYSLFFGDFEQGDTVVAALSNISEDYYKFLFAQERAEQSVQFISEPVSYPSNIEGGLGYFALHYPSYLLVAPNINLDSLGGN